MQVCLVDQSTGISPQDRGLIYGDGFFTTARISNHRILFWSDHRRRLLLSAKRLAFDAFRINRLEQQLSDLPDSGVIRICVTRGTGPRGYAIPKQQQCCCYIEIFDAPVLDPKLPKQLAVTICNTPISENPLLAGVKHINRLDHVLARTEAETRGFDEGLMCSNENLVCATQANLFVCRGDQVFTPVLERFGVEGVMKQNIKRWCQKSGLQFVEQSFCVSDLENCDEVFLSNSVFGIMSVIKIDDRLLSNHNITQFLYQTFIQSMD
jgi:4-amino-4-deoxychorismate lyase